MVDTIIYLSGETNAIGIRPIHDEDFFSLASIALISQSVGVSMEVLWDRAVSGEDFHKLSVEELIPERGFVRVLILTYFELLLVLDNGLVLLSSKAKSLIKSRNMIEVRQTVYISFNKHCVFSP